MLPESALPCYLLFFWMFAMIVTTHITKDPSRQLSDCIWSLDFSKLLPLYRSKMDGWFDGSVGAYMMLADSLFCFVTTLRVQREWDRRSETGTKGKEWPTSNWYILLEVISMRVYFFIIEWTDLPLKYIIILTEKSFHLALDPWTHANHEEVLIVGASGYIGKSVASACRRDGYRIHRLSTPNPATVPTRNNSQRKSSSRSSAIRLMRMLIICHSQQCQFVIDCASVIMDGETIPNACLEDVRPCEVDTHYTSSPPA